MAPDDFYPVDSSIDPYKLVDFDLYLRVHKEGEIRYVLFNRAGAELKQEIPGVLYVHGSDRYRLLSFMIYETSGSGNILDLSNAHLIAVDGFDEIIMRNDFLNISERINLVLRSSKEVIGGIFESGEFDQKGAADCIKLGNNIRSFIEKVLESDDDSQNLLSELIGYDYALYTHSLNVCIYSLILAVECKAGGDPPDSNLLNKLSLGALLHDIGMLDIDPDIVNKESRLSMLEYEQMKRHPQAGFEIIKKHNFPDETLKTVIQHHERPDGNGYPYGIEDNSIFWMSKVVSICDVFDSLTTNRPYRPALEAYDAALLMTGNMKSYFHRPYIESFLQFLSRISK